MSDDERIAQIKVAIGKILPNIDYQIQLPRSNVILLLAELEASRQRAAELQAENERLKAQYAELYETFGLQNWYKDSAGNIKTLEGGQP